jgi:hypothetical protein
MPTNGSKKDPRSNINELVLVFTAAKLNLPLLSPLDALANGHHELERFGT